LSKYPVKYMYTHIINNHTFYQPSVLHSHLDRVCNKYRLIGSLAHNTSLVNPNAPPCNETQFGGKEELVLAVCNVTTVDTWRRGTNVRNRFLVF